MNLVIVESPTKERTISKFLGKEFVIKSSYGHVCDLPKKELGIDIAKNFQPKYVMLPRAKKIISSIVKLTKKAKKIYLATDFDREGEAIAWHIVKSAKLDKKKTKRITFHEITPEAIHESLKNTHEIDLSLVNAQQARRILDRIVGYKLSPLLWRKIARGLSAGRVQSIVLRFIVEREKEIKEFKPQEYWTITAKLAGDGVEFDAALVSKDDTKFEYKQAYQLFADEYNVTLSLLKNKEETDKVIDELKRLSYRVEKIIRKKQNKTPPPPFTTSTLQQDAVYKLGYYSNKTMHVAQMLYEGIELPDGAVGLITYMRTDSVSVANSAREEARKYIIENFGDKYLPLKPPTYKTVSKGAQEAHECIRPTSVYRDPEKIKKYLTAEQHALYKLIWQRFLASQMKNAIYDVLTIEITGESDKGMAGLPDNLSAGLSNLSGSKYGFRTSVRAMDFTGYLEIYRNGDEENTGDKDTFDSKILLLKENDILKLVNLSSEQHFSQPPPRYNEASLIKTMEKNGIGRPSTYAPTIGTIRRRDYVFYNDKRFYPTSLGEDVNAILKEHFSEIVDLNFTANMEEKLDLIAEHKMEWQKVVREFYKPFSETLARAEKQISVIKTKPVPVDEKCDICGAQMMLCSGRYGKFLSCSNWPKCQNKISLDRLGNKKIVEKTDETCPKCGSIMLKRTGRRGVFLACSAYPKCRFVKNVK